MIRRAHDMVLGRGVDNNEGVQVAANGVAPVLPGQAVHGRLPRQIQFRDEVLGAEAPPARAEVVDQAAGPEAWPQAGGGVAIAPAAVVPAGGLAGVGPAVAPEEVVVRRVNLDHQYLGAAAADAMQEAARERRLRMMRFMMRVGGGRVPGQASLSNHIKEWLRPIQPKHGRTKLVTVIKALENNMHKHTGLDWQPLGHLFQAAKSLGESQRVAMYAQVFAFYLGCVPKYYPASTLPSRGPLEPDQSGFRRRLFSDNDPRALDAIMFYNCLEQLEVALHSLSTELLVTVEASLLIRLWMDNREESVKAHVYDAPWSLASAQTNIQERRSHIMDAMRIAEQRKEAIVRLMEEGFGERVWSFRAVAA